MKELLSFASSSFAEYAPSVRNYHVGDGGRACELAASAALPSFRHTMRRSSLADPVIIIFFFSCVPYERNLQGTRLLHTARTQHYEYVLAEQMTGLGRLMAIPPSP